MIEILKKDRWSPYSAGILIALLGAVSFLLFGKMLGASGFFVKIGAGIWYLINPEHLQKNAYYAQVLKGEPVVNYYSTLVLGTFIGSFVAGKFSKGSTVIYVPTVWERQFGASRIKRNLVAFIGGVFVLVGARLAGGCTSGLGISGGMQLTASAFVFLAGLFATAVPTAFVVYNKQR